MATLNSAFDNANFGRASEVEQLVDEREVVFSPFPGAYSFGNVDLDLPTSTLVSTIGVALSIVLTMTALALALA